MQGEPTRITVRIFHQGQRGLLRFGGNTHVVMGRGIGAQDTSTAPPVAVVNQAFVKQFFKDKNPIGQRIGSPNSPGDFEVVGVVERYGLHRCEVEGPQYVSSCPSCSVMPVTKTQSRTIFALRRSDGD